MPTGRELPPFLLVDQEGASASFPAGRPSLVCFVKDDCPTCHLAMPVLQAMHKALAGSVDFFVAGQTVDGNARLMKEFAPDFQVLDDSKLQVSFIIIHEITVYNSIGFYFGLRMCR